MTVFGNSAAITVTTMGPIHAAAGEVLARRAVSTRL